MSRFAAALTGSATMMLLVSCTAPAGKSEAGATAVAVAQAEPNVAEIRSAIEAANQKWAAAMLAGDMTDAIGNYADDAVLMMPMMPTLNGRAAIESGMKEMLTMMKVNDAKPSTLDVVASGDLAIETGTVTMTTTMKGAKPVTEVGKYLTVWKRQADGGWKIIRDINNSDGPPPKAK